MGLSGVSISLLGVIQKINGNKYDELTFSPEAMFFGAASLIGLALGAFAFIECQTAHIEPLILNADENFVNESESDDDESIDPSEPLLINRSSRNDDYVVKKSQYADEESFDSEKSSDVESDIWRVAYAARFPVCSQLAKATIVYFISPGILPFLTKDDRLVQILFFIAGNFEIKRERKERKKKSFCLCYLFRFLAGSNMIGRACTGIRFFQSITHLWALNLLCALGASYELLVAAWPAFNQNQIFPASEYILIPVTAIFASVNGFVSTQVYLASDNAVVREFGDNKNSKRVRRWVSLANQVGSLAGN